MKICEYCGAHLDAGERCDCRDNELPIIHARYAREHKKEKESADEQPRNSARP